MAKEAALAQARARLDGLHASPNQLRARGLRVKLDGVRRSARDLLSHPGIDIGRLAALWPELGAIAPAVAEQLEIEAHYSGYTERQEADIRAFRRDESLLLPADLDYAAVAGLSTEVRAKLGATRPTTLGAAARISGVTPAALTALLVHARRRQDRLSA